MSIHQKSKNPPLRHHSFEASATHKLYPFLQYYIYAQKTTKIKNFVSFASILIAKKILKIFHHKDALMAAVPNGSIKLKIAGKLTSGQYFYSCDMVRIIDLKR